jgi:ABC-type transporter Mla subunit MlaD
MPLDPELVETIQRIVDARIEPIRVHREEHEEVKAAVRRLEESHARVEDELGRLTAAQRETQESLVRFQQSTEEHLGALAKAQARTDERLEQLVGAQARTDERLEQLAGAQARTDERLEQLAGTVEQLAGTVKQLVGTVKQLVEGMLDLRQEVASLSRRLAEGMQDLRQEIGGLSQRFFGAVGDLRREVGGLSQRIGTDLEEIGRIVVAEFLREEEGIELSSLEGRYFRMDGEEIEVDLYGEGRRGSDLVVVIGECKARVYPREIESFYRQSERIASSLAKPVIRVVYCQRAHPDAERFAREKGIIFVPWSYQHRIWAQSA